MIFLFKFFSSDLDSWIWEVSVNIFYDFFIQLFFFIRFGFVEMGSVRGAERAVKGLDGTQVWGKQVFWTLSQNI